MFQQFGKAHAHRVIVAEIPVHPIAEMKRYLEEMATEAVSPKEAAVPRNESRYTHRENGIANERPALRRRRYGTGFCHRGTRPRIGEPRYVESAHDENERDTNGVIL